jgi:chitinase
MTMRTMILGLGFAAAAIAGSSASAGTPGDMIFVSGFDALTWVQGYYVGYERDLYPIEAVDFGALTHLMVGRVRPLADGTVTRDFDIDDVNGPIWAQSAVNAAHAAGRKAILMVGGAGEIDGWRAAASQHRDALVTNLLAAMDEFGFDGLDLDWEPLEDIDHADFQALATELRADRPNMLMTVPVAWINTNFQTSDPWYGTITPLFDRINIMTYDMAGPWDGWQSWHNSALSGASPTTPSSVASSVTFYLTSGVTTSQLGVGSAFYGYCWQGVTGPLQDGGTFAGDATLPYATIIDGYYSPSVYQWDATASVPYLSSAAPLGAAACNFVSYEDEQSIAAKGFYVRSHHLGGVIIWTIAEGHLADRPPGQQDPLLEAVRTSFLR